MGSSHIAGDKEKEGENSDSIRPDSLDLQSLKLCLDAKMYFARPLTSAEQKAQTQSSAAFAFPGGKAEPLEVDKALEPSPDSKKDSSVSPTLSPLALRPDTYRKNTRIMQSIFKKEELEDAKEQKDDGQEDKKDKYANNNEDKDGKVEVIEVTQEDEDDDKDGDDGEEEEEMVVVVERDAKEAEDEDFENPVVRMALRREIEAASRPEPKCRLDLSMNQRRCTLCGINKGLVVRCAGGA